jgi:hypothetical protein
MPLFKPLYEEFAIEMPGVAFNEAELDIMEEEDMIVWEEGSEEDPDGFHMFIHIYHKYMKLSTLDRLAEALHIVPKELPSLMKPIAFTYEVNRDDINTDDFNDGVFGPEGLGKMDYLREEEEDFYDWCWYDECLTFDLAGKPKEELKPIMLKIAKLLGAEEDV